MGRRLNDSDFGRFALFALFLIGAISCSAVYLFLTVFVRPDSESLPSVEDEGPKEEQCCRGVEHLELWGDAVKWGSQFVLNSSEECCMACKRMCNGDGGPCLCNSWVYCGDREACGSRFGEVSLHFFWFATSRIFSVLISSCTCFWRHVWCLFIISVQF